jgi:hypothetical protein
LCLQVHGSTRERPVLVDPGEVPEDADNVKAKNHQYKRDLFNSTTIAYAKLLEEVVAQLSDNQKTLIGDQVVGLFGKTIRDIIEFVVKHHCHVTGATIRGWHADLARAIGPSETFVVYSNRIQDVVSKLSNHPGQTPADKDLFDKVVTAIHGRKQMADAAATYLQEHSDFTEHTFALLRAYIVKQEPNFLVTASGTEYADTRQATAPVPPPTNEYDDAFAKGFAAARQHDAKGYAAARQHPVREKQREPTKQSNAKGSTYCYLHGPSKGHNGPDCHMIKKINAMAQQGSTPTFSDAMIRATSSTEVKGGSA